MVKCTSNVLEDSYYEVSWVGSRWQDIRDTHTLHFRLSTRLMHLTNASLLARDIYYLLAAQFLSKVSDW